MNIDFLFITVFFIIFFLLGYLFYSSIFAAIGSAVDNETDTQQFTMYPMFPMMIAMYGRDRKSTRLNSSHVAISYAVFCSTKKRSTSYSIAPQTTRRTRH